MADFLTFAVLAWAAIFLAIGVLLAVTTYADVSRYPDEGGPLPWYAYPTVAVFWPLFLLAVSVRRWRKRSRRG